MANLEDYRKYKSFYSLIVETKKWKELYKERSSQIAIALTIVFSSLLVNIFYNNPETFIEKTNDLIKVLVPALIGLLGFYIAGLAILASLVDKKTIDILEKKSQINELASVLVCYYFAGAAVLTTIIIFLLCYLFFIINLPVCAGIVYILIALSCFTFLFSLCYTVALLGSCINFLFLMFHLQRCDEENK